MIRRPAGIPIVRPVAFAVWAAALLAGPAPARAQMLLPGANNGVATGAPPREAGAPSSGKPASIRPVLIKAPSADTILGHPLSHDGRDGIMIFDKSGDAVALTKLKLTGDKISRPQQTCSVDIPAANTVAVRPLGRPAGALRFAVQLEACPFTIDVLDGAALVLRGDAGCDFKVADCHVAPGGLWGPAAADISASRAAELEKQRVRIETTMRTNFRALVHKAGKDGAAVKAIAREQAAFSSQREMTCRDYDREAIHGFCSTQVTEARALDLFARFGPPAPAAGEPRPAIHVKSEAAPAPGSSAAKPNSLHLLPTIPPTAHLGPPGAAKPAPAGLPRTPQP